MRSWCPSGGLLVDDANILPVPLLREYQQPFIRFDSDQMSTGNFFDPMDKDYAICLWIKMDDVTTKRDILDKYKGRGSGGQVSISMWKMGQLKAHCGEIEGVYNRRTISSGWCGKLQVSGIMWPWCLTALQIR